MSIIEPIYKDFDGEIVFCKKCNKVTVIAYHNSFDTKSLYYIGMLLTRFIEKMQYKILEGRIISVDYSNDKTSKDKTSQKKCETYIKTYGLCEECLKKSKLRESFDTNNMISEYLDTENKFQYMKRDLEYKVYFELNENLTPKLLAEINPIAFQELKNSKHFGIKKEKRRLAERYLEASKENIKDFVKKRFDEDLELQNLKDEVIKLENNVKSFINDCDNVIKGYTIMKKSIFFIPNPVKNKKLKELFPDKVFTNEKFYRIEKYIKKDILMKINDTDKLNLVVKEHEYPLYSFKKLAVKVSKMDIWN